MLARLPLVVLFLGSVVGAALGLHVELSGVAVAAIAAFVVGAAVALTHRVPGIRGAGLMVAVVSAASVAGMSERVGYERTAAALPAEDDVVVVEGIVVDDVPADEGRRLLLRVTGMVASGDIPGFAATGLVAVKLFVGGRNVGAGDRVRVRGRLLRPGPALSPGTYDAALAARARAVHAAVSVHDAGDIAVVGRGKAPVLVAVRHALRERLMNHVPPRLAGLLLALLIGDVSLFEDEQNTAYRHVGAGHLLAVSGLQVTLLAVVLRRVFGGAFLLLPGGRRRWSQGAAAALALGGVWAFVGVCGMPPSAVRAAVMASAVVVGAIMGRRVLLVDAIAAAGVLTVLASPSSVDDAGFLLSYAAVLALAATSVGDGASPSMTPPSSWPARLWAALLGFRPAIVASLTAGFATLPLSAWLFGQVAPAGLVANIVLVPVASALQLPALLCGVVGAICDWPWVTWCGGQAALLLESLVFGFADILPGVRCIEPPSVVIAGVGMLASLLAGALAMLGKTRWMVVCVAAVVAGFAVAAWEPRALRVTFLPVGQGDSVVVEFPDDTVMVIDAGGRVPFDPKATDEGRAEALAEPGKRVVVPFLQRRGIEKIDIMVVSHPHPDHAGGLRAVAQAMPVTRLWMAGDAIRPGPLMAPLIAAGGQPHVQSTPALWGSHHIGGVVVDVLAPAPAEGTPTYRELHANDNSLVLRLCLGASCVLLPGDLEAQGEELLLATVPQDRLRAQVVKAGHHGSRTSSTPAFVGAVGAAHVILCTGRHNTFGFPSPEVKARWETAGARAWDTAVEGEVRVVVTADDVSVAGFRQR